MIALFLSGWVVEAIRRQPAPTVPFIILHVLVTNSESCPDNDRCPLSERLSGTSPVSLLGTGRVLVPDVGLSKSQDSPRRTDAASNFG